MSDDVTVPSSFDGNVRLFPLPNVVLFPHVLLPLHIFEPHYRQMTADALASDRLLAMVLLKQGEEAEHSTGRRSIQWPALARSLPNSVLRTDATTFSCGA